MTALAELRSRLRTRLAGLIVVGWVCVGAYGGLVQETDRWLTASGSDLRTLLGVVALALVMGVPLGALAGSGPRWVDASLGFMTDWIGVVPAILLLAFVRAEPASWGVSLLWLGALRSLEVGWVVRSALLRGAASDPTWASRSLGYVPLSVFLRHQLRDTARPALAHLALTPAWTFLLDAVGVGAGLGAVSSERSLGALVGAQGFRLWSGAGLAAVVAVLVLTWALQVLASEWSLRLARK